MDRSTSEKTEVRRFFKKGVLFLLPLLLLFAFPLLAMVMAGELTSVDRVIRRQMGARQEILYGPAYSNNSRYYKLQATLLRRPDILVLGTSRMMQVRARFFKNPNTFYNAGGGVGRIKHFRPFLRRIPIGREPKVLVVGLDQYFFNPNYEIMANDDIDYRLSADSVNPAATFQFAWLKTYQDWIRGKFTLQELRRSSEARIGTNAVLNGKGFRNDGSYDYGESTLGIENAGSEDYQFRDTFARIAEGRDAYEHSNDLSSGAVEELAAFLEECRLRGIRVIGILPPYAHAVYQKMHDSKNYGYLAKLAPALQPIFRNSGFELFDFSDLASLGAGDDEVLDGFHAMEKAYLRLTIRVMEKSPTLAALSDH